MDDLWTWVAGSADRRILQHPLKMSHTPSTSVKCWSQMYAPFQRSIFPLVADDTPVFIFEDEFLPIIHRFSSDTSYLCRRRRHVHVAVRVLVVGSTAKGILQSLIQETIILYTCFISNITTNYLSDICTDNYTDVYNFYYYYYYHALFYIFRDMPIFRNITTTDSNFVCTRTTPGTIYIQ